MKKLFILLLIITCNQFAFSQDTIAEKDLPAIEFKVTKKTGKFNIVQTVTEVNGIVSTLAFPTYDSIAASNLIVNFINEQDSIISYGARELDQRAQYLVNLQNEYVRVKNEERQLKLAVKIAERRKLKLQKVKL